jgi:hypothetical protein
LTALVRELHSKQAVILEKTVAHCAGSSNPQSQAAHILDEFIRSCLDCAQKRWNAVIKRSQIIRVGGFHQRWCWKLGYISSQEIQTRVLDLVELCLLTRQMDTCRAFLDRIWNLPADVVIKFNKVYTPVLPQLCKLLRKTNIDVCAVPFIDFFRLLISHYLCHILRTKGELKQPPKLGCGCSECQELDRFLAGKQSQYIFRISGQRIDHLKAQIRAGSRAGDLVEPETRYHENHPHLVITKTHAFRFETMWEYRLQIVYDMFTAIGTKNVEKIMGDRYVDLLKALEGQVGFCLDDTAAQRQKSNVSGPASTSTVNTTTTSVIGGKRKREPEVIDLTD